MAKRDPNRRDYVMLAQTYRPGRERITNWFLSEKLDGQRAWWDGGITRGMSTAQVPWANIEKDKKQTIATGLWSRLGKVIYAPAFWLDQLPPFCLDGELYIDRGMFQTTSSIVKRHEPDVTTWAMVKYHVIDSPPIEALFKDGLVKSPQVEKQITGAQQFVGMYGAKMMTLPSTAYISLRLMYRFLCEQFKDNSIIRVVEQKEIPSTTQKAVDFINQELERIIDLRGEGVVLRSPCALWTPERSWDMLKYKPFEDDEATVAGYVWGRETDKGSKLLGMMGAMVVRWKEKTFEISGFKDEERRMTFHPRPGTDETNASLAAREGELSPGQSISRDWYNDKFPIGSTVTFRYRELSDAGIPKEARFLRKEV